MGKTTLITIIEYQEVVSLCGMCGDGESLVPPTGLRSATLSGAINNARLLRRQLASA